MLPDPWDHDLSTVDAALEAAWGRPELEAQVLAWLQRRSPGEWARLDRYERGWVDYRATAPAALSTTLAQGWRSFSAYGRVREAAVRALAYDPHQTANGFLIVRCDDWVGEVREPARDAVLARLRSGVLDLTIWMPLILAVSARSRSSGLLEAAAATPHLAERLLVHPDRSCRRWAALHVLARAPAAEELERLLEEVADPDVARTLTARLAGLADDARLHRLLGDRRAGVRRLAWEQVEAGRLPGVDLTKGLLDGAPSIRRIAQSVARARGVDARPVYLAAPASRVRLAALAEWDAPEAIPLARAALAHPDVGVRVTAIGVLALRLDDPGPLLLSLLPHVRMAELHAVRRGLLLNRVWPSDADLAALRAGEPDQRLVAWLLGRARGLWERLVAGLLAVGDPHPPLASAAAADLAGWWPRVAPEIGRPSPLQRRALEAALVIAERDGRRWELVHFVLRT
jgi:HEAT repeat protein